jgi:hypothetical protein
MEARASCGRVLGRQVVSSVIHEHFQFPGAANICHSCSDDVHRQRGWTQHPVVKLPSAQLTSMQVTMSTPQPLLTT